MRGTEYEIEEVIYTVSQLQAGVIDQLKGAAKTKLIKKTALSKRDKDEPKPEVVTEASAATQGPVSTAKTGAKK